MAEMKLETLGEILALGTLGAALKSAGQEAMRLSTGYTSINREYGTNIQMLQRWQNVARASNVPAEAVAQTFANMQKLLASPFVGNPNSGFMRAAGLLGIRDANKMNAEQLNEALRVAVPSYIRRMTPTQGRENAVTNAGSLLEALGATRSMLQLYTVPEARFRREERNSPVMSDRDVANWTALSDQIAVVTHRLMMLGEEILGVALPEILKWTNALVDSEGWVRKRFALTEDVAAEPWKQKLGPLGTIDHLLGSIIAPELQRDYERRQLSVVQNNKVDIHAHGADPAQLADHAKRLHERSTQEHLTQALQLGNTKEAY